MVFYEAPHKLRDTLSDMRRHFGNRKISLIREISKIYEEVRLTTLDEAAEFYSEGIIKGEFVLVVGGYEEEEVSGIGPEDLSEEFGILVSSGVSKSDVNTKIT